MKAIKLIVLAAMCMAGSYASAQDLIVKERWLCNTGQSD